MSVKQRIRQVCAVCGRSRGVKLMPFKKIGLLCPIHGEVVRGLIPMPTTVADLRGLFPARVTERAARATSAA